MHVVATSSTFPTTVAITSLSLIPCAFGWATLRLVANWSESCTVYWILFIPTKEIWTATNINKHLSFKLEKTSWIKPSWKQGNETNINKPLKKTHLNNISQLHCRAGIIQLKKGRLVHSNFTCTCQDHRIERHPQTEWTWVMDFQSAQLTSVNRAHTHTHP